MHGVLAVSGLGQMLADPWHSEGHPDRRSVLVCLQPQTSGVDSGMPSRLLPPLYSYSERIDLLLLLPAHLRLRLVTKQTLLLSPRSHSHGRALSRLGTGPGCPRGQSTVRSSSSTCPRSNRSES